MLLNSCVKSFHSLFQSFFLDFKQLRDAFMEFQTPSILTCLHSDLNNPHQIIIFRCHEYPVRHHLSQHSERFLHWIVTFVFLSRQVTKTLCRTQLPLQHQSESCHFLLRIAVKSTEEKSAHGQAVVVEKGALGELLAW